MTAGVTGRLGQFEVLGRRFDGEEIARFTVAATCLGCLTLFVTRRTGYRAIALPVAALPFAFWAARIIQRSAAPPEPMGAPPRENPQPQPVEAPPAETPVVQTPQPPPPSPPLVRVAPDPEMERFQQELSEALAQSNDSNRAAHCATLFDKTSPALFLRVAALEENRLGEALAVMQSRPFPKKAILQLAERCQTHDQWDQMIHLFRDLDSIKQWVERRGGEPVELVRIIQQWPSDGDRKIGYTHMGIERLTRLLNEGEPVDDVVKLFRRCPLLEGAARQTTNFARYIELVNSEHIAFHCEDLDLPALQEGRIDQIHFNIIWGNLQGALRYRTALRREEQRSWEAIQDRDELQDALNTLSHRDLLRLYEATDSLPVLETILRPIEGSEEDRRMLIWPTRDVLRNNPLADCRKARRMIEALQKKRARDALARDPDPISRTLLRLCFPDLRELPRFSSDWQRQTFRKKVLLGRDLDPHERRSLYSLVARSAGPQMADKLFDIPLAKWEDCLEVLRAFNYEPSLEPSTLLFRLKLAFDSATPEQRGELLAEANPVVRSYLGRPLLEHYLEIEEPSLKRDCATVICSDTNMLAPLLAFFNPRWERMQDDPLLLRIREGISRMARGEQERAVEGLPPEFQDYLHRGGAESEGGAASSSAGGAAAAPFESICEMIDNGRFASKITLGRYQIPEGFIAHHSTALLRELQAEDGEAWRPVIGHLFATGQLHRSVDATLARELLELNETRWQIDGFSELLAVQIVNNVGSLLEMVERGGWKAILWMYGANLQRIVTTPEYQAWHEAHGTATRDLLARHKEAWVPAYKEALGA